MHTTIQKRRIGELLVLSGVITQIQLAHALATQQHQGGKLVKILMGLGHLKPEAFSDCLARQPGIATVELSCYQVPREVASLVPREFAVAHEVLPLDKLGTLLSVGMVCPLDRSAIAEVEKLTNLRVKPLLCSAEDLRRAIEHYYPDSGETLDRYVDLMHLHIRSSRQPRHEHRKATSKTDGVIWFSSTEAASNATQPGSAAPGEHKAGGNKVLEANRAQILSDIEQRQRLTRDVIKEIDDRLSVHEEQLDESGPAFGPPAVNERHRLMREIAILEREKRSERAAAWRDVALLRKELRQLLADHNGRIGHSANS